MAGLMDAEGCFGIYKEKHGHYTPHIIFTNKFLPLRSWIVKYFGGVCTNRNVEGWKPYFHWQLSGKNAAPVFLRSVLPYLRLKRDQASIMLDFWAAKEIGDKDQQAALAAQIKALKSESRNDRMIDGSAKDKTTHAYLAGMFDGEGYISLHAYKRPAGSIHYAKLIGVVNTDLSVLRFFEHIYGGTIRGPKLQNKKPCYEWNLRDKAQSEKFLLAILPYIQVKRDKAKILLEFLRVSGENPAARHRLYVAFRKYVETKNAKPMVQSELHGDVQSESDGSLTS